MREKGGEGLTVTAGEQPVFERGSHHYGFLLVPALSDEHGILRGGSPVPTRVSLYSVWNVVDLGNLCI